MTIYNSSVRHPVLRGMLITRVYYICIYSFYQKIGPEDFGAYLIPAAGSLDLPMQGTFAMLSSVQSVLSSEVTSQSVAPAKPSTCEKSSRALCWEAAVQYQKEDLLSKPGTSHTSKKPLLKDTTCTCAERLQLALLTHQTPEDNFKLEVACQVTLALVVLQHYKKANLKISHERVWSWKLLALTNGLSNI